MSTSVDYIAFVCEQLSGTGDIRYKKMFGEYMVYVNDKPLFTVCDNTVYVKMLPELESILLGAATGIPYDGAVKERYILDIDDKNLCKRVVGVLEPITPYPKKKPKK